jgi:hypothetical protein
MFRPSPLPPSFIPPCLPTACDRCKSGPDWVHEIIVRYPTTGTESAPRGSNASLPTR